MWKSLSRSAFFGMLLFVLLLVVAVLAFPDGFKVLYETLGSVWAPVAGAVLLAVFAAGYSIISDIIFHTRYRHVRSSLCGYRSAIVSLDRIERMLEQDKYETTVKFKK